MPSTIDDDLAYLIAAGHQTAATNTVATAKAQLRDVNRALNAAQTKARGFQDPNLSTEGLAAKRAELDAAARAAAAPVLERLRTQVAGAAERLAGQAAAALPKIADDPAAIMRSQRAWDQARLRLDAGMSLRAVLANADTETALAIREWGPAYIEAKTYRTPSLAQGLAESPPPDHSALLRSVDIRLAELTGPTAVAALAAAHEAAGVAAYVGVQGAYVGDVIADRRGGQNAIAAAIGAADAERLAIAGLPDQAPDGPAPGGDGPAPAATAPQNGASE